jgi:hypothetical protein
MVFCFQQIRSKLVLIFDIWHGLQIRASIFSELGEVCDFAL